MSIVQIIRERDCPDIPWKNGCGTTKEIITFPLGAGMDNFLWRLSMARVAEEAPFSAFDGVDRTLAVIEGALRLSSCDFDVILDAQAAPFFFDGDTKVHGEPHSGPVRDLNAMVRRGAYAVAMVRLKAGDRIPCRGEAFVVALQPQELGDAQLDTLDCAQISASILSQGPAIYVEFTSIAEN